MIWFARVVSLVAVASNLYYATVDSWWWLRAFGVLAAVAVVVAWFTMEQGIRFRRQLVRDFEWQLAAASPDPILAMAQFQYINRLSARQRRELREWLHTHDYTEVDPEDYPPVVRNLVFIEPPREKGQ